jgi:hypothetical protein
MEKWGEMTQTMYAHMNKKKKEFSSQSPKGIVPYM